MNAPFSIPLNLPVTRWYAAPFTDLTRNNADLIAENAFLRQQLITLRVHRQAKKPAFSHADRLWIVLLAGRVKHWKEALLIFKPDTILCWHRQGSRLFWKFKSRSRSGRPKLSTETVALIQQMAQENRLWGAERIRGELLKLGLTVAKHTIQKYIARVRPDKPTSQTWAILLKNHAEDIWACDFLPVIDIWFRPLFLFFIVEIGAKEQGKITTQRAITTPPELNRNKQVRRSKFERRT